MYNIKSIFLTLYVIMCKQNKYLLFFNNSIKFVELYLKQLFFSTNCIIDIMHTFENQLNTQAYKVLKITRTLFQSDF